MLFRWAARFFCPQILQIAGLLISWENLSFLWIDPSSKTICKGNLIKDLIRVASCPFVVFPFGETAHPRGKKRFHIALGSPHKPEEKSAALPMGLEDFGGVAEICTRTDRSPRQFSPPRQSRALPGIQKTRSGEGTGFLKRKADWLIKQPCGADGGHRKG